MSSETPGERLRRVRESFDLSTDQVARRIGKAPSTVRAHENGQNGIKPGMAAKYAAIYRTTPEWVLFGIGDEPSKDADTSGSPTGVDHHLRAWREHRHMSVKELSRRSGISSQLIDDIERGEADLSVKVLGALAEALQTSPGFVIDHDPGRLDPTWTEATEAVPAERRSEVIQILKVFGGSKR